MRSSSFPSAPPSLPSDCLPSHPCRQPWKKRLVDMNVQDLREIELRWADLIFLGGMSIQLKSARAVIEQCKTMGKKIVAGGPLFTSFPDDFEDINYLVLNEAEVTLPQFLMDIKNHTACHCYRTNQWADVTTTPVPLWHLINSKYYSSMNIQYSRGCPYDCEFCDITVLYRHMPRTKTKEQMLLESLTSGKAGGLIM